ncbi:kinase-like domain-containing protein, partial [Baffinella frigidus]
MKSIRTPARDRISKPSPVAANRGASSEMEERRTSLMEEAMSLGDLVKSSVMQTLSAVAGGGREGEGRGVRGGGAHQPPSAAGPPPAPDSAALEAPRSLDLMFANRVALSLQAPGSTLPDANSEDGEGSVCSQDSQGSSVQLLDGTEAGTDAMARFMRRGHGELECHVCLQLFTNPVKPSAGGCTCTVHPKPRHATRDRRPPARGGGRGRACKDDAGAQVIPVGRIGRPGLPASRVFGAAPGPGPHRDGRIRIGIQRGVDLARHSSCSQKDQRDKRHVAGPDRSVLQKRNQHPLDAGPPARAQALRRGPGGRQRLHRHRAGRVPLRPDPHEAAGVCKGMTYLHSMSVIHRDLKPGNLLMSAVQTPSGPQLIVKVADFGLARVQDTARTMTGGIGTSQYTAPEVLRSERYDNKVDVFSFGVILWEIHAQKLPYTDMNPMQIAVAVATQEYRPPAPPNCPAPFWQLMEECWHGSPKKRPTFPQVLAQLEDMQYVFSLATGCSFKASNAAHVQNRRDA